MTKFKIIIITLFIGVPSLIFSQSLVYKPMNPFFGGDTFNYQQMLASANAQNTFKESTASTLDKKSDLENFKESLNNQLLNSLSRDLFTQEFGDKGLTVGTYVFGTLVVDITPATGGLSINILDTTTGDQTQITIPN
tara:strand:- start:1117 stop:1527 length:411 start_codon:yes stop_codon:yes gene_type:complete